MPETNPKHYTRLTPEPIEVIEAWNLNYHLGNAVKYISRAGFKDDKPIDLKKAIWYLNREIGSEPEPEVKTESTDSLWSEYNPVSVGDAYAIRDLISNCSDDEYTASNGLVIHQVYSKDADDPFREIIIINGYHTQLFFSEPVGLLEYSTNYEEPNFIIIRENDPTARPTMFRIPVESTARRL